MGLVALAAIWVAWLGFRVQTPGDYTPDYAPAMNALLGFLSDNCCGGRSCVTVAAPARKRRAS